MTVVILAIRIPCILRGNLRTALGACNVLAGAIMVNTACVITFDGTTTFSHNSAMDNGGKMLTMSVNVAGSAH